MFINTGLHNDVKMTLPIRLYQQGPDEQIMMLIIGYQDARFSYLTDRILVILKGRY